MLEWQMWHYRERIIQNTSYKKDDQLKKWLIKCKYKWSDIIHSPVGDLLLSARQVLQNAGWIVNYNATDPEQMITRP